MCVCVCVAHACACMYVCSKDFLSKGLLEKTKRPCCRESMWGGWMQKSSAKFPSWRISEKPVNLTHGRTCSTCQGTQCQITMVRMGFPCASAGKESACNAGDLGSIPELGRSPGEGKGYPLQYAGLENSMDCIVYEVAKRQTRMSDFHFHYAYWALSFFTSLPLSQCPDSQKPFLETHGVGRSREGQRDEGGQPCPCLHCRL